MCLTTENEYTQPVGLFCRDVTDDKKECDYQYTVSYINVKKQ